MSCERNPDHVKEIKKRKYSYVSNKNDFIEPDLKAFSYKVPCIVHKVLSKNLLKPDRYYTDDNWHWATTIAEERIFLIGSSDYNNAFEDTEDSLVTYEEARKIMASIIDIYNNADYGVDCREKDGIEEGSFVKYYDDYYYLPFKRTISETIEVGQDKSFNRNYLFILDATEEQLNGWKTYNIETGELTDFKPKDLIDFNIYYNQLTSYSSPAYEDLIKIKKDLDNRLNYKNYIREKLKETFNI